MGREGCLYPDAALIGFAMTGAGYLTCVTLPEPKRRAILVIGSGICGLFGVAGVVLDLSGPVLINGIVLIVLSVSLLIVGLLVRDEG